MYLLHEFDAKYVTRLSNSMSSFQKSYFLPEIYDHTVRVAIVLLVNMSSKCLVVCLALLTRHFGTRH